MRQRATGDLDKLAELSAPALRKALTEKPTLEKCRRVQQLLQKLIEPVTNAEQLQALRGVEVLEHIGTTEAKRLLEALAAGAAEQVAKWITDLDSAEFAVREKAMRELERRVEAVEGALRKALDSRPSLEVRQRVRILLGNRNLSSMDQSARTNLLRGLRAIELLEILDTTQSRRLLQTMAGAPLTLG